MNEIENFSFFNASTEKQGMLHSEQLASTHNQIMNIMDITRGPAITDPRAAEYILVLVSILSRKIRRTQTTESNKSKII